MKRALRCFFFFAICSLSIPSSLAATEGVLDLSGYNFWSQGAASMNANWLLYPHVFIEPSKPENQTPEGNIQLTDLWNNTPLMGTKWSAMGYASYSLTVYMPKDHPELGLKIPEAYTAYRLYLDGRLISENGVPGKTAKSSKPKWIPRIIALSQRDDTLHFVLHLSNFTHFKGGMGKEIMLDNYSSLLFKNKRESALTTLLSGGLVIGGLFFLGLFLYDRRDVTILYFSLFCIFYSYRVIGSQSYILHELLPNFPFGLAIRLEYLSLYISVLLFAEFLRHLYPEEMNKQVLRLFRYVSIFQALIVFLPIYYFTALFQYYLVAALAFMAYGLFIFILAAWRRRMGAKLALNSSLLLVSSFVVLILEFWQVIPPQPEILIILYIGFFLSQALLLSYRFGLNQQRLLWKTEASSRSKTEFISNMSHEIRTPLNAILGVSTLMENKMTHPVERNQMVSIRKHAEQLTNVINEILSFSELESDDIRVKKEAFDIHEVYNRLITSLEVLKGNKDVELSGFLDDSIPHAVKGDSMKFKQVLSHLGGTVLRTVEMGNVHLSMKCQKETPDALLLEVRFDIPAGSLGSRLLDFYEDTSGRFIDIQAIKSNSHILGLFTSSQIIKAMGGSVFVDGNPARSFGFKVPLEKIIKPAEESTRELNDKLRILVAEDNPVNRKLIEMMFNSFGLHPNMAEDGKEAYEKVRDGNFHMVFMDLRMPVMDGIESTRKIVDEVKHRPIIIALTANSTEKDRHLAIESGMNDFMTKPLKINELKDMILKWQSVSEVLDVL